jgi:hypothetical protein
LEIPHPPWRVKYKSRHSREKYEKVEDKKEENLKEKGKRRQKKGKF